MANALEEPSSTAAFNMTGLQLPIVTGLERPRLPMFSSKPSSNDWCPDMISGTMEEVDQVPIYCC